MPSKLVSWGLDYLTLIVPRETLKDDVVDAGRAILMQDVKEGSRTTSAGLLGYSGLKNRHCFMGSRDDGMMLRVTGDRCREYQGKLLALPGRASRMDVQLTYKVSRETWDMLQEHHDTSLKHPVKVGKHWDVSSRTLNGKLQTVYIGSRTSEFYGRIYDKFAESGEQEYASCLRYELELKGEAAHIVWAQVQSGDISTGGLLTLVADWFTARGVPIPLQEGEWEGPCLKVSRETSEERKIAWLATQVSPTLQDLIARGYGFPALTALLGQCEDDALTLALWSVVSDWYNE